MDQSINHKLKIDFSISNNTSLNHQTHTALKPKCKKYKKCNECNRSRKYFNEIHKICHLCYKAKTAFLPSGNKVIDDFIRYTLTKRVNSMKMEFVLYDRFEDVKFITEGGFSKIYKATWIDGPISGWNYEKQKYNRYGKTTVVLKELSNSKNINPEELNELKIFYNYSLNKQNSNANGNIDNINKYYGITEHPTTKNFMIITSYYEKGDLSHFITNNFFGVSWKEKLLKLHYIIRGLYNIHRKDIIHKDYHSGNIFIDNRKNVETAVTGDLGLSKSATESDNDDEIYGIIPYVAPEIFQGQKYTKASDIYSFGMIMWELMTGRRPFWDQSHDADLIIKICDGLRPPIVTNAPEGYIELMQQCWHSDPEKRPAASKVVKFFGGWNREERMYYNGIVINEEKNPTKIIKSPDIGPIATNPEAIYKSRPLSAMIKSAKSTISLKSIIYIGLHYYNQNNNNDKRKFNENNNDKGKTTKRIKSFENNDNEYLTKEFEFDINSNMNSTNSNNGGEYATKEIYFDI